MATKLSSVAGIGWLSRGVTSELAGHAFLVSPKLALTCAHVVREHLGLGKVTPLQMPGADVTIRFEMMGKNITGKVQTNGWFPTVDQVGQISDVAVLQLDEPLVGVPIPALAHVMPSQVTEAFVYGAEPDFQTIGQPVQVIMSQVDNGRGWRSLTSKFRQRIRGVGRVFGFPGNGSAL